MLEDLEGTLNGAWEASGWRPTVGGDATATTSAQASQELGIGALGAMLLLWLGIEYAHKSFH